MERNRGREWRDGFLDVFPIEKSRQHFGQASQLPAGCWGSGRASAGAKLQPPAQPCLPRSLGLGFEALRERSPVRCLEISPESPSWHHAGALLPPETALTPPQTEEGNTNRGGATQTASFIHSFLMNSAHPQLLMLPETQPASPGRGAEPR